MNTRLDELVAQRTAELQAANDQLKNEIAERMKAQDALQQAQKMEAVGQLAAGIAHDFNNILAVVQGNASLLLAGKSPGDPEIKPLESICAATDRACKLVRQLLTLSRKQLPDLHPMNVRDTLAAVSEMLPGVLTPMIDLEVSESAGLPDMCADARMLENLLMNLVANARDAMPGGGRLRVSADAVEIDADAARANPEMRQGRFVRLSVADTGCGIPPEFLPRIFEPFFTTKPAGKGTGLGLATVYGIARQHHGWVEVQSKVNEGATFHVFLPALASARPAQKPATPKPGGSTAGGETILVVEDEPDLRELVSQVLESCGYKVVSAGSGAEALEAWAKSRMDIRLLLTDMVLPDGLSGRNLADRLTSENRRLRVIYSSGYSAGMPGTELADVQERQFLAKPYRPATLLEVVRRCLDEPPAEMAGAAA
jgi:signal transduction histidine kinase/ActR/RegA family two-component response regulator